MNELTHLDLFSGIGGFALAAKAVGFRTVGFSEIEPYACRVLAERFPDVPNIGDVRARANFARFRGGVTVLTGGYPCQPFSHAGLRRGANDDRHLWPAMFSIFQDIRPAWGLCENVAGHITMGLDAVLDDLEGIGYSAQPFVVPACAVDAKHRRDRVWIVAYSNSRRLQRKRQSEHPDKQSTCRDQPDGLCAAGRRQGQAVANTDGKRGCLRTTRKEDAADAWKSSRREDAWQRWLPEPAVGRVAHGIPNRTHRLKGLGNAIVPQVAQVFLEMIHRIETNDQ